MRALCAPTSAPLAGTGGVARDARCCGARPLPSAGHVCFWGGALTALATRRRWRRDPVAPCRPPFSEICLKIHEIRKIPARGPGSSPCAARARGAVPLRRGCCCLLSPHCVLWEQPPKHALTPRARHVPARCCPGLGAVRRQRIERAKAVEYPQIGFHRAGGERRWGRVLHRAVIAVPPTRRPALIQFSTPISGAPLHLNITTSDLPKARVHHQHSFHGRRRRGLPPFPTKP